MRSIIALKLLPPPEAMTPILNMRPNIAICGQFQENYEGKQYCRSCWEKKEKEITDPCPECGEPVSRYERRVFGRAGYCPACWDRHMILARERFGRYEKTLLAFLEERGIKAACSDQNGLLPSGRPEGYTGFEERNSGMIRLRRNEYAVGAFRLGNGWFAIPERGSHLRYITPSPDVKLMEFLAGIKETCLAAAVWGRNTAVLTEDGVIHSTDPAVNALKAFDKGDVIREMAERILGEEKIRKAREEYMSEGIRSVGDRLFYDGGHRVFFRIVADGNFYHGYDVSYPVVSKEEILPVLIRREWLLDTEEACEKGVVPVSVIAEGLEDSGNFRYEPPDNFGYGTYFM